MKALIALTLITFAATLALGKDEAQELEELYPQVPIAKIASWYRPRAKCKGRITLVKKEADGDWHFRLVDLQNSKDFIICEIIPELPLPHPKIGTIVEVQGVVRYDGEHKWGELHPVTKWEVVASK